MFFIWVILAGLMQITVLWELNLLVLFAVYSGLRKGPLGGLLIGGAIGIFAGIISSSIFTLNLALYSLVGFLSGLAKSHIYYKENIFTHFLFSLCGLVLFYLAYFILTGRIQASIFSAILFSAALSPILFKVIEK
ncbi:MAG: hypothetical protein V3S13_00810 [Candidatus Omnitrophota bacterium]